MIYGCSCARYKGVCGSEGMVPLILNLWLKLELSDQFHGPIGLFEAEGVLKRNE
jgi:hypothetical protein